MIRIRKKGGYRILLLIPLLAILFGFILEKERFLADENDCIESLSFAVKEGAAEEIIMPFYS